MNLAASIGFISVTAIGLGGWIPGAGLGTRAFVAWALLPLILFIANAVFSIPLYFAGWIVVAFAGLGYLNLAFERRRQLTHRPQRELALFLLHPVVTLSVLAGCLAIAGGVNSYEPIEWDELSNWLNVTRQMFVADTVWRQDMSFSNPGYTSGWYLAMLFPNLPFTEFREIRSLAAGAVGTIVFFGLVYDVISHNIAVSAKRTWATAMAGAWLGTATILIVSNDLLIPKNTLIEGFQIQLTAAPFLLVLLFRSSLTRNYMMILAAGMCFAAGYFLKVAGMVTLSALPFLVLFLSWNALREHRDWGRFVVSFLYLSIPTLLVFILWKVFGTPAQGHCTADPFLALQWPGDNVHAATVLDRFMDRSRNYALGRILSWEGALGGAGIIAAVFTRQLRFLSFGILFFLIVYVAALYWFYLRCISGYQQDVLISLERFEGVALGVVLVCGSVFAILLSFPRGFAALSRRGERAIWSGVGAAACTCLLLGYETIMTLQWLPRLADPFSHGHQYPPEFVEKRQPILLGKDELKSLASVTQATGSLTRVSVVSQRTDGFEKILLRYHAVNGKRGENLKLFDVASEHSWARGAGNVWATKATPDEIRTELLASDIIWPRQVDRYIRPILVEFFDTPVCGNTIRWIFLWRPAPGNPYRCVPIERIIQHTLDRQSNQ
jgi:hypothetical protein